MRPEHLLHAVAGAKGQITLGIQFSVSSAQTFSCPFVTVMTLHHGEPIKKQPGQWQSVSLCCFTGEMTQPAFRQCKNHLWTKSFNSLLQRSIDLHRPDKILIIGDP